MGRAARSDDTNAGGTGHLRHQQAGSQSRNLDVFACQASLALLCCRLSWWRSLQAGTPAIAGLHVFEVLFRLCSGPVRYGFHDGQWVYGRDGHVLHDRLEAELSELLDGPVKLTR